MRGRRGLKGSRGPGPPSRPVRRLRGVFLRLRGGGAESDGGGGGGGLGGHRWRVRIARDWGTTWFGGAPRTSHRSGFRRTRAPPFSRSVGAEGRGAAGRAAVGTPGPGDPDWRPLPPRARGNRNPALAPGGLPWMGNRGSPGWGVGMWPRKASGFREPHREVDSQLCESASLRGRAPCARPRHASPVPGAPL